jgi:hypothetical protein
MRLIDFWTKERGSQRHEEHILFTKECKSDSLRSFLLSSSLSFLLFSRILEFFDLLFKCRTHMIWASHSQSWGRGVFDHQKPAIVRGCLSVMGGYFFWPFSFSVIFCYSFTAGNFVNSFLLWKGAKWVVLIYFWIVQGGGVRLYLFI